MAVGVSLHHALLDRGWPGFGLAGPPDHGSPPEMKSWMLARLDRHLNLIAEQHARIDTVLTGARPTSGPSHVRDPARFDSIATRTRSEIQAVLDTRATAEVRGDHTSRWIPRGPGTRDDAPPGARLTGAAAVAALSVAAV